MKFLLILCMVFYVGCTTTDPDNPEDLEVTSDDDDDGDEDYEGEDDDDGDEDYEDGDEDDEDYDDEDYDDDVEDEDIEDGLEDFDEDVDDDIVEGLDDEILDPSLEDDPVTEDPPIMDVTDLDTEIQPGPDEIIDQDLMNNNNNAVTGNWGDYSQTDIFLQCEPNPQRAAGYGMVNYGCKSMLKSGGDYFGYIIGWWKMVRSDGSRVRVTDLQFRSDGYDATFNIRQGDANQGFQPTPSYGPVGSISH